MVLTPVEFHYLAKELEVLEGSVLKNMKRAENFDFEFKGLDKKALNLIVGKDFCYLTNKPSEAEPDGFCNFLLNKIGKEKVQKVEQNDFNKVLIFSFSSFNLVFEFIGKGNIVLCDKNYLIITALMQREFRDRKVLIGEIYVFPKSPEMKGLNEFKDEKTLVSEFHLGKIYAQQIARKDLTIKKLLERKASPRVYFSEGGEKMAAPFEIESLREKFELKETLSQAIEEVYDSRKETKEEIIKRGQEKNAAKFEREAKEFEEKAKMLMGCLSEVETAIRVWKREKKLIGPAKKVSEKNGTIVVSIEENDIEIPLTKDVRKTIDEYFAKAKKSRAKIGKTKEWLERSVGPKKEMPKSEKKAEWFDQFRNFVTSDGFLVILGKDADTNEKLIKKYCKKDDICPACPYSRLAFCRYQKRR